MKSFDLGDVQCFKQEDKEQIMDIVDNYRTGRKVPVIAAASPVLLPPARPGPRQAHYACPRVAGTVAETK